MVSNFHTHSTYCDGKDNPEDMVLKAIELKCPKIGFSGHSYTFFDESYCMSKENVKKYMKCINELKDKYKDKIKIYLGIEQDFYSTESTDGFDYVIGAVHYVKKDDKYIEVDGEVSDLITNINKYYHGDFYKFIDDYYMTVAKIPEKINCNILAHFDLITKFNEKYNLFDEKDSRYINSIHKALDILMKYDIYFEINTGAMARGYTTKPYPDDFIIQRLVANNKKLIYSSDCHDKNYLLYGYDFVRTNYPIVEFEI